MDLLHKSNPWAGQHCGRDRCLLCETKVYEKKKNGQDCRKRNCVYKTYCITCRERQDKELEDRLEEQGTSTNKKELDKEKAKIKRYVYIGETNRSAYERGIEHQQDVTGCKTSSHMLRHLLHQHEDEEPDWDKIKFGMTIIKSCRTAFERQILESVEIQKARDQLIMNDKSEYNRCALPRLTTRLGEKELKRWREEDRIELEKEATIEEKIRVKKEGQGQDKSRG